MQMHPGISMHRIPVAGGGGLIFAAGMASLFVLGVPGFRPVVAACLTAGALFGIALHASDRLGEAAERWAPVLPVAAALLLGLGNDALRGLALASIAGGIAMAPLVHRAHADHPSIAAWSR